MQELEKILEEIEQRVDYYREHATFGYVDVCAGLREAQDIIRKYMNDGKCGDCNRRKWYQKGYEDGKNNNDGWIPVDERLPEEGETVLCTDGDYVYLVEYDADFDAPFGDIDNITGWQPSPEPYRPERSEGE